MNTYIANHNGQTHNGGFLDCYAWSAQRIADNPEAVVTILKLRAGEKNGRIVAELTAEGMRHIDEGLSVRTRKLRARHG